MNMAVSHKGTQFQNFEHDDYAFEQLQIFCEYGVSVSHLERITCKTSSGAVRVYSRNILNFLPVIRHTKK